MSFHCLLAEPGLVRVFSPAIMRRLCIFKSKITCSQQSHRKGGTKWAIASGKTIKVILLGRKIVIPSPLSPSWPACPAAHTACSLGAGDGGGHSIGAVPTPGSRLLQVAGMCPSATASTWPPADAPPAPLHQRMEMARPTSRTIAAVKTTTMTRRRTTSPKTHRLPSNYSTSRSMRSSSSRQGSPLTPNWHGALIIALPAPPRLEPLRVGPGTQSNSPLPLPDSQTSSSLSGSSGSGAEANFPCYGTGSQ